VAVVAGVLLDEVDQQPAQRDRSAPGVGDLPGHPEVGRLGHVALGERHLLPPGRPGLRDDLRLGYRPVEVRVRPGVGDEAVRDFLPGHDLPEPAALHLGQVPQQSQQRQGGGPDAATGHGGGAQARALQGEGLALPAQERGANISARLRGLSMRTDPG